MRCPFCIQQQSPKICSDVFSIRSTPMWDIPFWCSIAHFRTHQRLAHLWFHRPWKYNDSVDQFYVITDDTSAHKKADITKEREETDLGEAWLSCYMQLSNTLSREWHVHLCGSVKWELSLCPVGIDAPSNVISTCPILSHWSNPRWSPIWSFITLRTRRNRQRQHPCRRRWSRFLQSSRLQRLWDLRTGIKSMQNSHVRTIPQLET